MMAIEREAMMAHGLELVCDHIADFFREFGEAKRAQDFSDLADVCREVRDGIFDDDDGDGDDSL